ILTSFKNSFSKIFFKNIESPLRVREINASGCVSSVFTASVWVSWEETNSTAACAYTIITRTYPLQDYEELTGFDLDQ
ncbi:hypothetical protein P5673_009900, partial [Acropora cervicornis]